MNIQTRKQQLRQSIIAGRAALPQDVRTQLSHQITARLLYLAPYREAVTVLGYMHFRAEFISEPWLQQVLRDGKRLLLPRVDPASWELDVYHVEDVAAQLAPGAYGIREPQPGRCARLERLEDIDLILLPGVAFTREGARLGYGGGFYDKLLARIRHNPALVAGAYSMQIVGDIPQEATDHKVGWLVTENETLYCAA
ncbi:MAG: 5-formyltetrahydrofolate cyclo-ligase [Gallionellaceae bacterium]